MKQVKETLQEISKDLFSFSFCLIPDDLQVQQILVDCVYLLNSDELTKSLISQLNECENIAVRNKIKYDLKILMAKNLYMMAKKRYFQVKDSLLSEEGYVAFYSLEFDQRATVFLKQALKYDFKEIEQITSQDRASVVGSLSIARQKLSGNMGVTNWSVV